MFQVVYGLFQHICNVDKEGFSLKKLNDSPYEYEERHWSVSGWEILITIILNFHVESTSAACGAARMVCYPTSDMDCTFVILLLAAPAIQ